ncbi:N-acetyltransferase [Streptomyces sp. NPDC001985]|uniref:GNAT family N-acetyltransferase n=1 Tax=Streptomyces sp. NPDC001985 TaxID=3154406 RepID=UPI0033253352
MSAYPQVRPFHREDRDQLTTLVNAHAAAVVPGATVSVNTVLSSLERCPDEYITDPWIAERTTLVAEHRQQIVGAAHLLRYRNDPDVGEDYRDTGHIAWFVHNPGAFAGPDGEHPADLLMAACLAQLTRWHVRARHTDGQLPAPGVTGVPEQWPHVRAVLERAGFVHTGHTEILLIAAVAELPAPGPAPLPGLTLHRTLGDLGTRLTARLAGEPVAHVELDTTLERPERHARSGGVADIADLVLPDDPHPGLLGWLLGEAGRWLALCGCDRVLAYADESDAGAEGGEIAALTAHGFHELTRTARGWEHRPARPAPSGPGGARA